MGVEPRAKTASDIRQMLSGSPGGSIDQRFHLLPDYFGNVVAG